MPDTEKVIKRLEECLSASCRGFRTCPYSDDAWDAVEAVLALLKAKPSSGEWLWDRPHHFRCSVCEKVEGISATLCKYCPHCGSMMFLSETERRKEWPKEGDHG